jgi:serine/threonine protein kinase/WD40 repeat protein
MPVDPVRLKAVFSQALAEPDPSARAAVLAAACGGDADLRSRVEALLRASQDPDSLLDARGPALPPDDPATRPFDPAADTVDRPEAPIASVGDRVGPYKLLERIGEGGMGEVWVADQLEPIKRRVALKLIKPGMDSRSVLGRFEAERQALAVMDHPNIAKVLDAGTTADGRPYFVMELVKGTPITQFADARKLTPRQRLELFVPVCQAIQHAHMKGIIHRDIKPGNVLVALHDEVPVPKVIDFGVAKAVGQQLTDKTIYTGFGALVGTPTYMAPEQATFNQLDVDTRADVYALGVLLYELLAGSPPIEKERLKKAALDEVLRIVRDEEPPRPSQRLSTSQAKASIAATRGSEPAKLSALMKGELDWIVMKALEKDRTRRYETANGFVADVQRYLAGEQVQAVPPSLGYRLRKFVRKHRGPVLATAAVAAAVLLGFAGTTSGMVWALGAEQQAKGDRDAAVKAEGEANDERTRANANYAQLLEQQSKQRAEQYSWDMQTLPGFWETGRVEQVRYMLDRHPPEFRGFEWHYWNGQTRGELSTHRLQDVTSMGEGKFSRDGSRVVRVVSASSIPGRSVGPTTTVWDVAARKILLTHEMTSEKIPKRENPPTIVESWRTTTHPSHFSADGKRLALTRDTRPIDPKTGNPTRVPFASHFQVVDVDSGKPMLAHDDSTEERSKIGRADRVAISPDGRKVAVAGTTGTQGDKSSLRSAVHIWNLETGGPPVTIESASFVESPFTPDGSRIVLTEALGTPIKSLVYDTADGKQLVSLDHGPGSSRALSPDGVHLAFVVAAKADAGGAVTPLTLRIWDIATGKERFSLPLFTGSDGVAGVSNSGALTFSPDGSRLAVRGLTAAGTVHLVLFDPVAGKRLGTVTAPAPQNPTDGRITLSPLFSPDGKQLVLASGNVLTTWEATTGRPQRTLTGHRRPVVGYSFTGTGQLRSLESDGTLKDWEVRPAEPFVNTLPQRPAAGSNTIVVSADGRWVATGVGITGRIAPLPEASPDIEVWDVDGKGSTPLTPRPIKFARMCLLAISSDGQRLALLRQPITGLLQLVQPDPVDDQSGDLTVWDTVTRKELRHITIPASDLSGLSGLAISPDGSTVAVGSPLPEGKGGTLIQLFDVASGRELSSIRGAESLYRMLWFSPDGKRIAALGTPLIVPGRPAPKSTADLPLPKLAVWDVATGDSVFTLDFEMRGVGMALAWSPDCKRLAVFKPASETLIQIHDAVTGKRLTAIESPIRGAMFGGNIRNIAFSPDGRRIAAEMPSRSGSPGSVVCVWNAESGKELLTLRPDLGPLKNPGGAAAHVVFSPDGHRLLHFKQLKEGAGGKSDEKVVVTTWDATPMPDVQK